MNELQRQVLRNRQIRVEITQTFDITVPDNRYRCLVSLMRSDRPQVFTFECMKCHSKVCQIVNSDIFAIDDFYDPQNIAYSGVSKDCKGITTDGLPCRYTYFFNLQ